MDNEANKQIPDESLISTQPNQISTQPNDKAPKKIIYANKDRIFFGIRTELILKILTYLDTPELQATLKAIFIHATFTKDNVMFQKDIEIIKNFKNIDPTQGDITKIFDYACKQGHMERLISLLIEFQNEIFHQLLLNKNYEAIKIFKKYRIKPTEEMTAEILIYVYQLNEQHVVREMMALIDRRFSGVEITEKIFKIMCQKAGVERAIEILVKFEEEIRAIVIYGKVITKYQTYIDRIFYQALSNGDIKTMVIFARHCIEWPENIVSRAFVFRHKTSQDKVKENVDKVIVTAINNQYYRKMDLSCIFTTTCDQLGVEYVLQFFAEFQKKIPHYYIEDDVIEKHKADIDKIFHKALLNGNTEMIRALTKYYIKPPKQMIKEALTYEILNNQQNAKNAIIAIISKHYSECSMFNAIHAQQDAEHMIQFFVNFHRIHNDVVIEHKNNSNEIFNLALSDEDTEVTGIFEKYYIKTDRQITIENIAKILMREVTPGRSKPIVDAIDYVTSMSPKLHLCDNDMTKIFNIVCEQKKIANIINLLLFLSESKYDGNIDRNAILQHQDILNEVYNQALLAKDSQITSAYVRHIKPQEQLDANPNDKKSYQQFIVANPSDKKSQEQSAQNQVESHQQSIITKLWLKLNECNIF